MRKWTIRTAVVATVVSVALAAWWSGAFRLHDYEEFTPPPAEVYPRADCATPPIPQHLARGDGDGATVVGAGSISTGFTVAEVIRCEIGINSAGVRTIDAVTLQGDVDAVADAFRIRSRRPPDGVSVSCAVTRPTLPSGLWLVGDDGSAIVPQWPEVVCGYREEPATALHALRETARVSVMGVGSDLGTRACALSPWHTFRTTDAADADRSGTTIDLEYRLASPTVDVDAVTLCGYRTYGETAALTGSRSLDRADTRRIVSAGLAAPPAPACDRTATEVIAARMFRADGSGGDWFLVEADGCRRFMIPERVGYRLLPDDVQQLVVGRAT